MHSLAKGLKTAEFSSSLEERNNSEEGSDEEIEGDLLLYYKWANGNPDTSVCNCTSSLSEDI